MNQITCSHTLRRARRSLGLAIFMGGVTVLAMQGASAIGADQTPHLDPRIHTISSPAHGIGKHVGIAT
ncbi:hypothetical protein [Niveibacterium sp.]|uniref:hypothetical protein n=1 Tax=Niveibacterium sp. TaxID=2017444 RepID=UPI0035B3D8D0